MEEQLKLNIPGLPELPSAKDLALPESITKALDDVSVSDECVLLKSELQGLDSAHDQMVADYQNLFARIVAVRALRRAVQRCIEELEEEERLER